MKKFVFKCIAAAVALTTLCTSVFATATYTVTEEFENDQITVIGTAEVSERIGLQILKKGKTFDSWTQGSDINDFVLWQGQVTVGENGEYTLGAPYAETLPAGDYEYRLVSNTEGVLEQSTLALVGTKTHKDALAGILAQAQTDTPDYDVVSACIDGGDGVASPIGLDLAIFNKLSDSVKQEALGTYLDYVAEGGSADYVPFDEEAAASRNANFRTFMLFAAIEQGGVIDNLKAALEGTAFANTEAELWANLKDCVIYDYEWAYITNKIETVEDTYSIVDFDDLKQALIEALILCETRYADGNDIQNVLSTLGYGEDIGISNPTDLKKVYAAMAGKEYADIEDFKEAYKAYVKKYSESGVGGGTGGNAGTVTAPSYWEGKYPEDAQQSATGDAIKIPYIDVEGILWAAEAITALTDKGIIAGRGDGYFYPEVAITREEFVKILVAALGYSNSAYSQNYFSDVADNEWFCSYVNIAYEKGLVKGIGNGMFGVGQQLTRQDMVVMLYNALAANNVQLTAGTAKFNDGHKIADYAKTAVGTLYTMGVVEGVSETEFAPLGIANRAQAAKVVYGVLKILK